MKKLLKVSVLAFSFSLGVLFFSCSSSVPEEEVQITKNESLLTEENDGRCVISGYGYGGGAGGSHSGGH